jgi:hypothetical protein
MKEHLLSMTQQQVEDLAALQRSIKAVPTNRISRKQPLNAGAATARHWFDVVRPALEKARFAQETLDSFSRRFEGLLLASASEPSKRTFLTCVTEILGPYRAQVVHQIEISTFHTAVGLSIAPYIEGLPVAEGDYLDEAQRCLTVQALRGCIVLGWCATIARIHAKIQEIGFDRFSKAKAPITGENLYSFFSDITQIVLKNPKFELAS